MNQRICLACLFAFSLALFGCGEDSPTVPVRAPRNTFADYQHIGGLVSGVWTKDHNPYVITGETYIKDGDSLIIQSGVEIVVQTTINLERYGRLAFNGSHDEPIRFVHNSASRGGGVFAGTGMFRAKYTIFEGSGKTVGVGMDARIEHCVFSELQLNFYQFYQDFYDSTIVRDCIFAGYRPWDVSQGGAQVSSVDEYDPVGHSDSLDSMKTKVVNNLFFTGIGDSTWAMDPPPVVDVLVKGQSGTTEIKDIKWPGNGNIFANPQWVKYNYVGPSPAGISDNDYHLQPGSAAIGAASDGTNIGAY